MTRLRDGFEGIEEELDQLVERQKIEQQVKYHRWLYIVFMALFCGGVFLFYRYTISVPATYDNLSDYANHIVSDTSTASSFNWTYENYLELDWNEKGASNTTLEQVIEQFGKPTEATVGTLGGERETLTLFYQSDDSVITHVQLMFADFDGQITLVAKSFSNLDGVPYADVSGDIIHDWKAEEFSSLMVGDAVSGDGGMSIDDVLKTYGAPKQVDSFGYGDRLSLSLHYFALETGDNVTLFFAKDKNGAFHLAQKSGETDDYGFKQE